MLVRNLVLPSLLAFSFAITGCKQSPPVVNIDTSGGNSGVSFTSAYDLEEGSSLDLVVESDTAGAVIASTNLPKNATLQNGIFSFTPDYSQSGLYSINFTITSGETVAMKTIGVRVHNVIHIATPPTSVIPEGSPAPDLLFVSDDPQGTLVNYSADLSQANLNGNISATFDPTSGKLSFSPSFRWLDTQLAGVEITVTAEGTEVDTGEPRVSTAKVLYQVQEATSFKEELLPLFLLPLPPAGVSPTPSPQPQDEDKEGHNCLSCHDGTATAPAGMDFHAGMIYDTLINQPIAPDNTVGSVCHTLADQGARRVTPGDLTKSLWFMKISGTDGMGNPGPPCGAQMPETQDWNWWTVNDQDSWNECPGVIGPNLCREKFDCAGTDVTCKLDARLVRKAAIWIMAGAPPN